MKNKTRIFGFLAAGVVASTFVLAGCKDNTPITTGGTQSTTYESAKKGEKDNPFNLKEAAEKCAANDSTTRYYVKGKIKEISDPQYGQMVLEDETGTLDVYGSYGADGEKRYNELLDKPQVGDTVLMYATLVTYNSKSEIKSGWIISFEKASNDFDPSAYEEESIADARLKEDNSKVKLSGTVAKITYASGKNPSGIYLVDNTNSIYVYDSAIASNVEIGNNITVYGTKTHYILEKEKTAAAKHGYKGCNQLIDCRLESNDNKINIVNYDWVKSSTVKDIMNTPANEDITTTIYKVNALIKKAPGDGFLNYYIDDLDGVTGSYVYTQDNGNDLDYLEPFDGKICTVYLSAINAKSSDSGCIWRFIPVSVIYENYKFDLANTNDFVLNYYAMDQFDLSYEGDPEAELVTSVSSELLGFENATISYVSSDENVFYFENSDGKVVLHAKNYGNATITVTASYNGVSKSQTIEVEYKEPVTYDTINISDVYTKDYDTEVIVKGIVAAGVTNQKAFYLVDETGMIACRTDDASLATIALGQEIVVKGKFLNNSGDREGQLHLEDVVILTNLGGNNTYSNASFEESTLKTVIDLCTAKSMEATGKVYVVEASVKEIVYPKYSNIELIDDDGNELQLYTSSSKQYEWLLQYEGKLKFELTVNAWNAKYKGSVLAIILEDGTRVCNATNFNK